MTLTQQPPHHPRSRRTLAAAFAVAALAFAGFMSLGIWQVERLAWKEALITRVTQHANAAPVPAPEPAEWPRVRREADEYRRVSVQGRFAHERETLVRASTELGSGYWVLTPLYTDQGFWVLVNRGFVTPAFSTRASRQAQEPLPEQPQIGLLRLSEPGGSALQQNDAAQGRWYSRDVQAMAAARGLPRDAVAPYFIDLVAPEGQSAQAAQIVWPRPGLTVLSFTNNHLVYALTWFALAAMTVGAMGYLIADERRLRRLSQTHGRA